MGLIFNAVAGELPLVQRVWSASCDAATGFASAVKASSMIAFARSGDGLTVHLRGPETAGTSLTCSEGWEFFGVDLRLGAYLPLYPPSGLTDLNDALLPTLPGDRILLDNRDWEMPTEWNAEVLVGDAVDAVAQLKKAGDGTLVKYGNGPFSRALVEAGLLDELHLGISPFVAGSGESLLSGISTTAMDLTGVTEIGNGAVVLTYTPSR